MNTRTMTTRQVAVAIAVLIGLATTLFLWHGQQQSHAADPVASNDTSWFGGEEYHSEKWWDQEVWGFWRANDEFNQAGWCNFYATNQFQAIHALTEKVRDPADVEPAKAAWTRLLKKHC